MPSLTERIVRNTLSTAGLQAVLILVNIFLIPYIVSRIGAEAYGLWALATVLLGMASLVDLGIGNALIKYTAELQTRADFDRLNNVSTMILVLYFSLACLFSIGMALCAPMLASVFSIPLQLSTVAVTLFVAAGGLIFLMIVYVINRALLIGLQRYDLANLVTLVGTLVNFVLVIVLLSRGHGVYGLLYSAAVSYTLQGILGHVLVRKQCPALRWSVRGFSVSQVKHILRFSLHLQAISLGTFLNFHLPKILLGLLGGMASVTYYEIAYKVVKAGRELSIMLYAPLFPVASRFWTENEKAKLVRLYWQGTKYLAFLTLPLWVFFIVFAKDIILIWMGPGYDLAGYTLQVLGVANILAVLSGVAGVIVQASPYPQLLTRATLLGLLLNVVLGVVLHAYLGFVGVPAALAIALVVSSMMFMAAFHRRLESPLREILKRAVATPALALGLPVVVAYGLYSGLQGYGVGAAVSLGIVSLIYSGLYLFVIRSARLLDQEDLVLFSGNRFTRFASLVLKAS